MTLKKTITISILLHICVFSAALVISAKLLEGSGKPQETVVFVRLAADEPKAVKAAPVPVKEAVEKAEIPTPVKVEPEPAISEIAVEKAVEMLEDAAPEELAGVQPLVNEIIGGQEDHAEEAVAAKAVQEPGISAGGEPSPDGQGLMAGTIELISMAIEKVKTYPVLARKRGIEGIVHISFNIMADGSPYEIKILKSSGFSILDKATVNVVKKAAPFPLVANRIELPVSYRLRN